MATRKSDANQNETNNQVNADVESTAGDILEQMKADAASTSDLYKLESKLYKTVTDMNKTLLAEQKIIKQSKKNQDSITAAVRSVERNVSSIGVTISSVDNTLRQILTTLGHTNFGTSRSAGSNTTASTRTSYDAIELLTDHINDVLREQERLTAERDAGDIDDTTFNEAFEDTQSNMARFTSRLNEVRRALAEATGNYDEYASAEERFADRLNDITLEYATTEMTLEELNDRISQAKEQFDAMNGAVEEAQQRWESVDKPTTFSQDVDTQIKTVQDNYQQQFDALKEQFLRSVPDENGNVMSPADFEQSVANLISNRDDALSGLNMQSKILHKLDEFATDFARGRTYNVETGENTTASAVVNAVGELGGELLGEKAGAAIGEAIGGPVGAAVGSVIGDFIGSKITDLTKLIGDQLNYLANHDKKSRDEVLKAGFEKIRSDVRDMATYSIEIYEKATSDIYNSWDKNLAQVTATQGYTKEALNSLQDAVAQRLQSEGYGTTINAADFADQLANTLNANLGGTLAEAFAAQNLILQKAVPEVDLSANAAQFAAIYANVNRQGGNGEEAMIAAMNEIAGAAKALESVTEGNNQFLKETGSLLTKATEVVNIAGGNATQISSLTSQMMASEAAITSVAPQLSGFTNELISVLMNNNDATAVSLRAIMNDMNSNIGVSATSFMQSFMEDTQGTLSTAFAAIQRFIDSNENPESRQEFLNALESVFGVSGSKLAQIDFGSVSDLIAEVNTKTNMNALTKAENLVKSGETTTLEEQLVANTSNQLLATNAIGSTLDNKLMRKLETNELTLEKVVYQLQATQSVDLAENTLGFFTKISDLIMSIIDPLGLFDMVATAINAETSALIDAERYVMTSTMSSIGSTVADSSASVANTIANTIGGASAAMYMAQTKSTDAMVAAVQANGVTQTFENMVGDYYRSSQAAQAQAAANMVESNEVNYHALEQQARQNAEYQQKQQEANAQDAEYEKEKAAAREEQRRIQEEEELRAIENHENITLIKDAMDSLDVREYLVPILEEHKVHTEQINKLDTSVNEIMKLISTIIEYNMNVSPEFESTISYDDRARIMDNGYVSSNAGISFR